MQSLVAGDRVRIALLTGIDADNATTWPARKCRPWRPFACRSRLTTPELGCLIAAATSKDGRSVGAIRRGVGMGRLTRVLLVVVCLVIIPAAAYAQASIT